MTEFPDDWVPAAGLPRFAVPFGRDSLITGLQTLMWNPHIARSVLRFLARRQGQTDSDFNYEQPGKIMHELHTGELARLKAVPFGQFYGSVDSTVLFLVLGGEYIRWTDDLGLYHELKENFERAWEWIDKYGDIDGSGYVQYKAHTPPRVSTAALTVGLFNQGWKDSSTAVMYSNGTMCTDHPVALAEVQGDLYRALRLWAHIYQAMPASLGLEARGRKLEKRAAQLKAQFNHEFWMPEKGYFAMALDGHHRQVDSITSNPAECLWARLIDDDKVEPMCKTLMSESMFTTWGIRTMANKEAAYNPFSYHDGSIWPFENSIIASGLKKYGLVLETQRVFDALMDASLYFEYRRWPEVYAGIDKTVGGVIARQPDASRPQAWSAGAIFLFMQTVLGISTNAFSRRIDVTPALPDSIDEITVDNIAIAGGRLGLRLVRQGNAVLMEVRDNPNDLDITIHPATRDHTHVTGENMPAVSR
jgi:glycogen debranching enzyme